MKIKILGGLLVAFLAITTVAEAQAPAPLVRHRQHRQERRIARDFRQGKITRAQAYHLRNDERRIGRERRMAMATGRFTPAERRHLHREQRHVGHAIRRDERDDKIS